MGLNNSMTKKIFNRFCRNLIAFLDIHVNMFKLKIIVVGGNISKAIGFFLPELIRSFNKKTVWFPFRILVKGLLLLASTYFSIQILRKN